MENQNPIIIYRNYSEAQKRAVLKWRADPKNKPVVNGLAKKYYDNKKNDPEYVQRKREAAKRHYLKKKELMKKANLKEMFDFLEKKME
jgi:hypothetical protein